jgi:hypothetical protein
MDFPENPYLSPQIHCLHVVYNCYIRTVILRTIYLHNIWLYFKLQWGDLLENLCLGPNEYSEYPHKKESWSWRMIIFMFHYLSITCLISLYAAFWKFLTLHFNRRNTVYFKTMAHCACFLWNVLEQVWGNECAVGGLWWVMVGIVWLWAEGIKWLW